jgi:hypothetical protein
MVPVKSADLRPNFLFSLEGGITLGFYANLSIEKRLGNSPFYAGIGYNFNRIILGGSAGDMAWLGKTDISAALLSTSYRTSYLRSTVFCFTLGMLIAPQIGESPVLPLLKVSLMRTD